MIISPPDAAGQYRAAMCMTKINGIGCQIRLTHCHYQREDVVLQLQLFHRLLYMEPLIPPRLLLHVSQLYRPHILQQVYRLLRQLRQRYRRQPTPVSSASPSDSSRKSPSESPSETSSEVQTSFSPTKAQTSSPTEAPTPSLNKKQAAKEYEDIVAAMMKSGLQL